MKETIPLSEKIMLSVGEASQLIGISERNVYTLIRKGDFPSFKLGGRRFVNRKQLEKWCAERAGCADG